MKKSPIEMTKEELWQLFPIQLEEYRPIWAEWYLQEEALLKRLIPGEMLWRINHFGSTSVEGLLAKPTVDILLEISHSCNIGWLQELLQANGYLFEPQPNNPAPHMMFMKGYTSEGFAEKVFHLHVRYPGDWDELYFRDYLRCHKEAVNAYAQLKCQLKDRFEHDRDGYTHAKGGLIARYTALARAEFSGRYDPSRT